MDKVHTEFGGDHHKGDADLGAVANKNYLDVVPGLVGRKVVKDGDDVAHFLGGVVVVGHTVDDGDGGFFGEFNDAGVAVNAGHNEVTHAGEDLGGVTDGFVGTELDGAGGEVESVAAELFHRHFKRHPGAGGLLFKNHGEVLVVEGF